MFFIFKSAVADAWGFWTELFAPLPYGDPYLAIIILFAIIGMVCKLLCGRETA